MAIDHLSKAELAFIGEELATSKRHLPFAPPKSGGLRFAHPLYFFSIFQYTTIGICKMPLTLAR
jgi:hypothetical protein